VIPDPKQNRSGNESSDPMEQTVQRLQRLASLGTIAAGMAHEIKNALVAVKTFVDTLVEQPHAPELGPIVAREIQRISSIVSHMLRLAQPSAVVPTRVRIEDVLERAMQLVQNALVEKDIQVDRRYLARNSIVLGEAFDLEQAFLNLFLNACAAMPPGGRLSVATQDVASGGSEGLALRVSVADTGCGIPEDMIERVFEPFVTTKGDGSGLGLFITRRIFQQHGGCIRLSSRVHEGTTFAIELPAAPPEKAGAPA
jgi:signal transduction histidine kinase